MPYEIRFLEEKGIISIENSGELTYDELIEQTKRAINLGLENNSHLFLTDFSNVAVHASTMEVFQFPEIYEQLGMAKMSKIAVLVSGMELNTEELKFYETICLNRGWQVKIYLEKEPAIEWLIKK
jgi:hypothetical protein